MDLPDDLVREVKLRAVKDRRPLKDLVAEFLRQGLGMEPPEPAGALPANSMVQISEKGMPVIRCRPKARATRMSVEELLKLEQETQAREDSKNVGMPL